MSGLVRFMSGLVRWLLWSWRRPPAPAASPRWYRVTDGVYWRHATSDELMPLTPSERSPSIAAAWLYAGPTRRATWRW